MDDYTMEEFMFGTEDRVRVILDDDPQDILRDMLDNGLSLHCINGSGWNFDPLPSGADSHSAELTAITDHAEYDDDELPLTKHFERAGLSFKVVSFTSYRDFRGAYIAYGETDDMDEAWIESDCEAIQQYLDGEVYALVHEKRVVYANVMDPEDTLVLWVFRDQIGSMMGYSMAELRYAAIEHFALPEQD